MFGDDLTSFHVMPMGVNFWRMYKLYSEDWTYDNPELTSNVGSQSWE